eukprot:scaffold308408_cov15-Tisochrysis_lutea.AAC.1
MPGEGAQVATLLEQATIVRMATWLQQALTVRTQATIVCVAALLEQAMAVCEVLLGRLLADTCGLLRCGSTVVHGSGCSTAVGVCSYGWLRAPGCDACPGSTAAAEGLDSARDATPGVARVLRPMLVVL